MGYCLAGIKDLASTLMMRKYLQHSDTSSPAYNIKLCDEYLGALSGDRAPKAFGTQNGQAASIPLTPFVCAAVATRRPSFGMHQIQIIASLNVKPIVPSITLKIVLDSRSTF